ncbi:MAG: hypothetical protein LBE78_11265 [Burkholderiaceae bacterium]|nr:hypothetical protein [Burkholderiaceae bacterium]
MARRSGDLSLAARQVLIMVNGIDSVMTLAARGLPQLQTHLAQLREMGLIAPVPSQTAPPQAPPRAPPPVPPRAPSPARAAVPPAPPPPSPVEPSAVEPDPRIDAQCRIVLSSLQSLFGPNAPDVARAMLMARTADEFNAAIDHIESRLIGHLGRKRALRETQTMRLEPK